jgi:hypothetical protein
LLRFPGIGVKIFTALKFKYFHFFFHGYWVLWVDNSLGDG